MSDGEFFVSWQLWQEMTFVLAMGITVVFFVGLIKLWVSNRHMRRLEKLDAEKQTRITQIKKSGISSKVNGHKYHDIPFGVKALERNVEVEGIWVARMASMASRPPERKWSSMRKMRRAPSSTTAAAAPKRTVSPRRRTSKICRSEIVVPSSLTRNKLDDLSLLEAGQAPRDLEGHTGRRLSQSQQSGHGGALGKIQRGLKRVAMAETRQAGGGRNTNKKAHSSSRRASSSFGAKQFREGVQARTPQRFYPPTNTTDAATPLVGRNSNRHERPRTLVKKQSATRQARSSSRDSQASAATGRAPSTEQSRSREHMAGPPSIPARVSSESAGGSAATTRDQQSAYRQPRRNSRDSLQHDGRRRSADEELEDGTTRAGVATRLTCSTSQRYPPNSSRSGGAYSARSRSFN